MTMNFQNILDVGPFAVIKWKNSIGWPVEWASENIKALTGYSAADFTDEIVNFYDLLDEKTIQQIDEQLKTGQESVSEKIKLDIYCLSHKDSHKVWVEHYISVIRNELGNITGYLGYLLDVSSKVDTERQFANSRNETRALINALPDTILQISKNGKLKKYLSRSKEGENEQKVEVYLSDTFPADFAEHIPGYLEEVIATGNTEVHEYIKTSSSREILHYEARFSRVDSQDVLIIIRDISERKRHEARLKQAMAKVDNASREKNRFLSNMSHELRTPLNAILGFAQLLSTDGKSDPELSEEIINAGEHLLSLITDILDISKIEAGKIELDVESISVYQIIDECYGLIGPMARQNTISISVDKRDEDVNIMADRTRLVQVMLNLLSNAIKYNTRYGKVLLVYEQLDDQRISIQVTDTGQGLDGEQIAQLYKPFERVGAEKSQIEGSGLGLALTKQLIELMNAQISVESEVGKGSTFAITFEIYKQKSRKELLGPLALDIPVVEQADNASLNMVYIEDNPQNQRLIQSMIKSKTDHELHIASSGEDGLKLIETVKPDLILLDIDLPNMDGYEVFRALQQASATRQIPVIAISANATARELQKGKEAGFYAYLTKPVNVGMLLETIHQATGMSTVTEQQVDAIALDKLL